MISSLNVFAKELLVIYSLEFERLLLVFIFTICTRICESYSDCIFVKRFEFHSQCFVLVPECTAIIIDPFKWHI